MIRLIISDNGDIYIFLVNFNHQGVLGLVRSMGRELPSFKKYHCLLSYPTPRIVLLVGWLVSWFVCQEHHDFISQIYIISIYHKYIYRKYIYIRSINNHKYISQICIKTNYHPHDLIVREKVRMVGISPLFVNTELVGHHNHHPHHHLHQKKT